MEVDSVGLTSIIFFLWKSSKLEIPWTWWLYLFVNYYLIICCWTNAKSKLDDRKQQMKTPLEFIQWVRCKLCELKIKCWLIELMRFAEIIILTKWKNVLNNLFLPRWSFNCRLHPFRTSLDPASSEEKQYH